MEDLLASTPVDSWHALINAAHAKPIHRKNVVDDGFYSSYAKNACFAGLFEIPELRGLNKDVEFSGMIPFSELDKSEDYTECVCFYQNDPLFADVIVACDEFIDELAKFPCVLTPDCSLYRDMPLALQIANVYLSRLIGHHCEERGLNVLPGVRWGDERSYADELFAGIPFAFIGVPKGVPVAIGSYGCVKNKENRYHFKAGLDAMLDVLEPPKVYVYGSLTPLVFDDFKSRTEFVQVPDWTRVKHGEHRG